MSPSTNAPHISMRKMDPLYENLNISVSIDRVDVCRGAALPAALHASTNTREGVSIRRRTQDERRGLASTHLHQWDGRLLVVISTFMSSWLLLTAKISLRRS